MASSWSYHLRLLLPFLLAALLLLPLISCDANDLVMNRCSNVTTYNQSSPTVADKMLSDLLTLAPENNFAYTYHFDPGLYGLAWCRGDFSANRCSACLAKAADRFVELCSHDAIAARLVVQDFCYIRLDVEDFMSSSVISFGRILYDLTAKKIVDAEYWASVGRLMGELKETIPQKEKRFAKMEVGFEKEDLKIHGMGQCVKGISEDSCKDCLDQAMKELETQCIYRTLCEIFYEKCVFQFYTQKN